MKQAMILLSGLFLLILTACGVSGRYRSPDYAKTAEERLRTLLHAVEEEDRDGVFSMFSKKVLDESENMDGEMDALFELLAEVDETVTWKSWGSNLNESKDNGQITTWYWHNFLITVGEREIRLTITEYLYTPDPALQGVCNIVAYDTADETPQLYNVGLYYPNILNKKSTK